LPRLDDRNRIAFAASPCRWPCGAPNAAIAIPVPGHRAAGRGARARPARCIAAPA